MVIKFFVPTTRTSKAFLAKVDVGTEIKNKSVQLKVRLVGQLIVFNSLQLCNE